MTYFNKFVAVIKSGNKILREKENNTVFLPFGCEYSIFLKNLNSQTALVKIDIDGESIGNSLILGGNTSIDLERFIGNNLNNGNRFKFIQKTKEIIEHRGDRIDDGIIRIEVNYEKIKPVENIIHHYHHHYNDFSYPTWTYKPSIQTFKIGDVYYDTVSSNSQTLRGYNSSPNNCFDASTFFSSTPLQDEGITVKGSESNQSFVYGNIGELEETSHTIILRLRGYSESNKKMEKPVTVKTKLICETCGKHNKSHMKYCGRCGTFLS